MKKQLNEVKKLQKLAGIIKESVNEAPAQGITPVQIATLVKADFDSSGMVDPISKLNQSGATLEDFEAAIPLLQKMGIQVEPQEAGNPGEKEWLVHYKGHENLYLYAEGEWFGEYGGYAEP